MQEPPQLKARARLPLWWIGAWTAALVLLSVAIGLWQGDGYWDYSDGVYTLSAREILSGAVPYRDFAAAQPPLLFGAAAAVLGIHDGLGWLRVAMAAVDGAGATLVLICTLRLTGARLPAALAGLAALVTPWALHEHAQLTPETFAAPLLLGAALTLSTRKTVWVGSLLGAAAALFKLAFGVPALLMFLAASARWRALAWATSAGVVALVASLVLFGTPVLDGVLVAQLQSGRSTLHAVAGLWAQAGWNLVVLVLPAGLAVWHRGRSADPELLRLVIAGAIGALALLVSLTKQGSYLNVLVVMELPLLVLAAAGATWALNPAASTSTPVATDASATTDPASSLALRRAHPLAAIAVAVAAGLWIVQVGTLVVSPDSPRGFTRPFSARAHERLLTPARLSAAVQFARACPAGAAYGGAPAIAYRAHRRRPGGQADPFIVQVKANARFARLAAADQPTCAGRP